MSITTDKIFGRFSPAVAAGILCLLVFLGTLGNDFIYTDDPAYVYNNTEIRSLGWRLLTSAFTRLFAGDYWMPLTWISFSVDYRFWGLDPTGYHLTNSLLHAINTGLVVLITAKLLRVGVKADERRGMRAEESAEESNSSPISQRSSFFILLLAGLLWGIHPLRVESVAWVMARKDVLNGFFTLGSVLLYISYVQRRSFPDEGHAGRYYAASLALFICSLMAKPSSVVLPVMLLVVDWCPLGRLHKEKIPKLLLEKVPFLTFSAAITVVTIIAKLNYGGLQAAESFPFSVRAVLSGNAVFEYVRMYLWPTGIIFFYPIPKPLPTTFIIKAVVVALATVLMVFQARKRPWLAAPWLCFLLLLLPVLAFMLNGMDIALATRFTYLASVVPSVTVAVALTMLFKNNAVSFLKWQRGVVLLLMLLVVWYAGLSMKLISSWKDTGTLWTRQIEVMPLGRAYNARGHYYLIRERYPEADRDFSTALDIAMRAGQPFVDNILAFRGEARYLSGHIEAAVADYSAAIALNPHPRYFYHRGLALKVLARSQEAENDFVRAGGDNGPIVWFAAGEK